MGLFFLVLTSCQHRVTPWQPSKEEVFDSRSQTGYASWYGDQFHGKKTASGQTYDMYSMTAAHRTAPFGTNVRVTNLQNGKQITVTITDRGPFVRGRIIDLSKKAAREIGMIENGTSKVRLEFLDRKAIDLGDVYIQNASFGSEANANQYLHTLKQTFPNLSSRIYKENRYFRVRTGPYDSDSKAQSDLDQLKKSGFGGFILHPE